MNVVPIPVHSSWAEDLRGQGRAVRASAHPEEGVLTLSVWNDELCVGSVQLAPDEVAALVAGLTESLAHMVAARR